MGQNCSMPDDLDNFQDTNSNIRISSNQEQFIEGLIPVVNQNPKTFNDDEPIDLSINNNKNRYGQSSIDMMQRVQYDLNQNLQVSVQSMGIQQLQNSSSNLAIMVSLDAKEIILQDQRGIITERPGIDLICVLDHSGSMSGQKIRLVKDIMQKMLEFLGPQDRLCLIQFDCRCYRLTRLMRVTAPNKFKFLIAINSIQARGGTNIENGMHMAFSVLRHRRYKNPVAAIFLLSDGVDEGGEERVAATLRRNYIPDPFTIKTFGFGRDVCPRLMNEIAHMKEGQFYFVPDLNSIDQCFVEALGGLVSVVANNLKITIKVSGPGRTQITKAYGDKWQYNTWNGDHTLYQPHLLSGVKKSFIFEVNVPSQNRDSVFVNIKIEADPIEGAQKYIFDQSIKIDQINENQQNQQEVMSNLMRVKGAECFNQALQHAENGNYLQGQKILNQQINQMQAQGMNDELSQMVRNDLQLAQQNCFPGSFQQEGRHHMMQLHIVHMYQKSRGVQIVVQDGNQQQYQQQNGNQQQQQAQINCQYQNNIQIAYKNQMNAIKSNGNQL